ncbi:DUF2207 domain-containing protein [Methanobrevibacter olleyae]|uniref:DUF2207 domain-containing protein n=1 Tax=Methanobrevibacter olleyae TaxID=294671 RepID=A0A126QYL2_METOL|nr:DUF2207 domain-containing protein [Methanobrevibacter olleyae]AMK15240.1 hypothetical protein YLM1_0683 [Methanobrevibacter olleyae]
MNLKNKAIVILLISIFFISVLPTVSAVDYSIPSANIDIRVYDNGLINVAEEINYHFDSSANGVYRDIPLKKNQSIENLDISVDGAYASYKVYKEDGKERIKIYLYSDAAKTKKISSGTDVKLTIKYDFTHVIKIYNDVGELQYKVWGDEWEEDLGSLNAVIRFPDDKKLEYWINPAYSDAKAEWTNGSLHITSPGVSEGQYVEARAIIPLSEFSSSTPYAQHINKNAADEIRGFQEDEANSQNFLSTVGIIVDCLLVLLCLIPLVIYYKFGREPKTGYQGIYEHEPPTDDSPAFVNALMGGLSKNIGELDQKAFQATIMDLIDKGKLGVDSEEDTEFTKNTFLTIKSTDGLERYEKELIDILKNYELNGRISLSYMQDCLREESQARSFQDRYKNWCINFKNDYLPDEVLREYFDETGSDYMSFFAIGAIALAIVVGVISIFLNFKGDFITLCFAIFFAIVGGICLVLPSGIGGKYTLKGKLYSEKWDKFKKFLKDYSLIKEHPPESIAIWNKYLVYATALGVADKVYKAMKLHVYDGLNDDYYTTNSLFMFYYLGGYNHINNSFSTASSTISAANNNSVGGVGGGSGGGGGGAF